MSKKYLYYFSEGNEAFGGDKVTMKNTLGGKGAGLAEMTAAGMPVPQGFTITTDACTQYYADGRQINDEITADIFEHLKGLEKITGKKFGDNTNPLLVSVRSGARQFYLQTDQKRFRRKRYYSALKKSAPEQISCQVLILLLSYLFFCVLNSLRAFCISCCFLV